MKTSTNAPFVQTPVATQADGAIPTQVETSTATQAEAVVAAVLPSIPPCKVSMTVPVSGLVMVGKSLLFGVILKK